jgi:ABC-2 type transport system ATP-binding protein
MKDMITIQNLTKTYGKHRGVEDVTFSVREGEIFGFLGPNGAGKSTTIRSMLGLIKYDQGEIRINGFDSVKDREKILADIGYMPSEAWFYPGMKIREILKYSAAIRTPFLAILYNYHNSKLSSASIHICIVPSR